MLLNQFEYFVALSEYNTMAQAAEALDVPQSSISTSMRNLEQELGVDLLIRTKKGTSFTDIGKKLLEVAEDIVSCEKQIHRISNDFFRFSRPLRIGSVQFLCNTAVINTFFNLRNVYPEISRSVEIVPDDSKKLLHSLQSGSLDYALITTRGLSKAELNSALESGVVLRPILASKMIFAVRPDHPLTRGTDIPLSTVLRYPFASFLANDSLLNSLSNKYGIHPDVTLINDMFTLRQHLNITDSVLITDEYALLNGNNIFKYQLVSLSTAEFSPAMQIYLSYLASNASPVDSILEANLISTCKDLEVQFGRNQT